MSPALAPASKKTGAEALCSCDACTALRDGLSEMNRAGDLPAALIHDDGSPVLVTVAGQDITAAEAHLRLALIDLPPSEAKTRERIRDAIASLKNEHPLGYEHRYKRAAKLAEALRS